MLLEDLILKAVAEPNVRGLETLLQNLRCPSVMNNEKVLSKLDLLLESWDENGDLDVLRAGFCLELANLQMRDGAVLRRVLTEAIRKLLPPYLNKPAFIRAMGCRDNAVAPREVVHRFNNLLKLKNNLLVFLRGDNRWGIITNMDTFGGSIALSGIPGGGNYAVPLEGILEYGILFDGNNEVYNVIESGRRRGMKGSDFAAIVKRRSMLPMGEDEIRRFALMNMVPAEFSEDEFNQWWSASGDSGKGASRRPCNARSLKEMETLLEGNEDTRYNASEVALFAKFFTNLRPEVANREAKLLAQVIAGIVPGIPDNMLQETFSPLIGKAPFWPANLADASLESLEVWGNIAVKQLDALVKATAAIFQEEYIICCMLRLPLRCLNAFSGCVDMELLEDTVLVMRSISADLLLWIWKNRKKLPREMLSVVNIDHVVKALNLSSLPKAWLATNRELKTSLLDKEDFQQQIINAADKNADLIAGALHGAIVFSTAECQSLLVKLSRISPEMREYLEGGGASKFAAGQGEKAAAVKRNEPFYTSASSRSRMVNELDMIVNVHVPENREALKTARAHGDFRENSEYDAAKERRNFLSRRRQELERDINNTMPISFVGVKVEDAVVIGSVVELEYIADKKRETFYLLGAWDGNPDRNFLSYRTKLGEVLLGSKVGSKVKTPGKGECLICSVKPLPAEIIAELDHVEE